MWSTVPSNSSLNWLVDKHQKWGRSYTNVNIQFFFVDCTLSTVGQQNAMHQKHFSKAQTKWKVEASWGENHMKGNRRSNVRKGQDLMVLIAKWRVPEDTDVTLWGNVAKCKCRKDQRERATVCPLTVLCLAAILCDLYQSNRSCYSNSSFSAFAKAALLIQNNVVCRLSCDSRFLKWWT